ncbi:MAG: nucleotidyltransferase domain-containing protein [Candidatus Thermoplasmatota archaeon]|nr:nucleotidyltransferase domain-containing protein [Candidatus Thermoplasmatota archaeon]
MDEKNPLLSENATARILEWFSRNQSVSIHVNELARKTGLSNATCSRIPNILEGKGLLLREEKGNAHFYSLNDMYVTKEIKRFFLLLRIHESDLIETLSDEHPSLTNLVLYGSCARGTFDERSDLDILAIMSEKMRTDLTLFEEGLGINIGITSLNIGRWLAMKERNEGFYNEVKRDGIVLYGGDLP